MNIFKEYNLNIKDKDGKLLKEGDIIQLDNNSLGVVSYYPTSFDLYVFQEKGKEVEIRCSNAGRFLKIEKADFRIIGSVYHGKTGNIDKEKLKIKLKCD